MNIHANGNDGHPYRDSLVDALVAGGSAFFGILTGMAIAGILIDPFAALVSSGIAFGGAFFFSLQVARKRT